MSEYGSWDGFYVFLRAEQHYGKKSIVLKSPIDILERYRENNAMRSGIGNALHDAMLAPIVKWTYEDGRDLVYLGIRKEEGKARRSMLLTYGNHFYCNINQIYEAFPMADWSATDIFSYIVSRKLEHLLHPAYLNNQGKKMEDIRVSWICHPLVQTEGSYVWLKKYYPKTFNQIREKFPEVANFL